MQVVIGVMYGSRKFEDDETAKIMNQLFVNIKVDREERPDLDLFSEFLSVI